jgi:hypothetical protein
LEPVLSIGGVESALELDLELASGDRGPRPTLVASRLTCGTLEYFHDHAGTGLITDVHEGVKAVCCPLWPA